MKTLYHFGDSYSDVLTPKTHFVNLITQRLEYNYNGVGKIPGGSNEMILNKLLSCVMDIKSGDILFFNFSFFVRGCYYDREENKVMSTNHYYHDQSHNKFNSLTRTINTQKDYIIDIVSHQLDYNEDYNRRLFHQFNTIFERLHYMGVKVFYIFIVENEWSDSLLKYGTKITFPTDFSSWLDSNGYHNQEECHYTRGVQGDICDYVMVQVLGT